MTTGDQTSFTEDEGMVVEDPAVVPTFSPTALIHELIGFYVDTAVEVNGEKPHPRWKGQMQRHIKEAVNDRLDPETIRAAIRKLVADVAEPKDFPSIYMQVQSARGPVGGERELIRALLDEHEDRWPTGARMVRGSHSANLVYDPLGYEPIPSWFNLEGSGIHRPTRSEVLEALKSAKSDP